MITFKKDYFFTAIFLLLAEIFLAVFVKDKFFRPYFGDFLVVILLYCILRSFLEITVVSAFSFVLLFAYAIEFFQYVDLVGFLDLQNSGIGEIVLGNHFDWKDIIAYTLGIIFVAGIEKIRNISAGNQMKK